MRAVEDGTDFGLRARKTGEVIETRRRPRPVPQDREGRVGVRRPGPAVRRHHQRLAHQPRDRPDHRVQPVLGVHVARQLLVQPGLAEPAEVPQGRRHLRRRAVRQAVELIITAMDISICFADFPTEAIGKTTVDYRQLGIGYANLGALLMAMGLGYDSDGGRAMAAAITSLMTGTSYKRSAELAGVVGPYAGYARNADAHKRVMRKHQAANDTVRTLAHRRPPGAQAGHAGLGRGHRARRDQRLPQRAGLGARADRHHRLHDGLRHHRHRARLLAGQVQEARRRRLDADRQPDDPAGAAQARLPARAGRGDRRLHRRARPRGRRPRPEDRALRDLRHRDGRPLAQADGPRADDGRGAAVPVRCDLQDGQPAGDGHRRGDRGRLPPVVEARPQGHRDLPRQLQGRPAPGRRRRQGQEGRCRRGERRATPRRRPRSSRRSSTPRPASGCRSRAPRAPPPSPWAAPRAT